MESRRFWGSDAILSHNIQRFNRTQAYTHNSS
ncbi:hypothetical protein SPTP3101_p27 [Staphylococcus phage tp310-1]|uniref:Uncharacterized protein n=1 Tax=Staphylococcus phage tp310-1 TaxID=445515 RepID=A7TWB2_9CAUD|nr:hypothetical protein SPTP3101_p27 [Staphylococcus phage tp310-1]ABS87429.1 hypothetical protein [Staphylococcus phage tp310-1]